MAKRAREPEPEPEPDRERERERFETYYVMRLDYAESIKNSI